MADITAGNIKATNVAFENLTIERFRIGSGDSIGGRNLLLTEIRDAVRSDKGAAAPRDKSTIGLLHRIKECLEEIKKHGGGGDGGIGATGSSGSGGNELASRLDLIARELKELPKNLYLSEGGGGGDSAKGREVNIALREAQASLYEQTEKLADAFYQGKQSVEYFYTDIKTREQISTGFYTEDYKRRLAIGQSWEVFNKGIQEQFRATTRNFFFGIAEAGRSLADFSKTTRALENRFDFFMEHIAGNQIITDAEAFGDEFVRLVRGDILSQDRFIATVKVIQDNMDETGSILAESGKRVEQWATEFNRMRDQMRAGGFEPFRHGLNAEDTNKTLKETFQYLLRTGVVDDERHTQTIAMATKQETALALIATYTGKRQKDLDKMVEQFDKENIRLAALKLMTPEQGKAFSNMEALMHDFSGGDALSKLLQGAIARGGGDQIAMGLTPEQLTAFAGSLDLLQAASQNYQDTTRSMDQKIKREMQIQEDLKRRHTARFAGYSKPGISALTEGSELGDILQIAMGNLTKEAQDKAKAGSPTSGLINRLQSIYTNVLGGPGSLVLAIGANVIALGLNTAALVGGGSILGGLRKIPGIGKLLGKFGGVAETAIPKMMGADIGLAEGMTAGAKPIVSAVSGLGKSLLRRLPLIGAVASTVIDLAQGKGFFERVLGGIGGLAGGIGGGALGSVMLSPGIGTAVGAVAGGVGGYELGGGIGGWIDRQMSGTGTQQVSPQTAATGMSAQADATVAHTMKFEDNTVELLGLILSEIKKTAHGGANNTTDPTVGHSSWYFRLPTLGDIFGKHDPDRTGTDPQRKN